MKRTSIISLSVVVLIMGSAFAVMCETPVYGGVLRVITAAGPQALSYVPIMGPTDASHIFPGGERLVNTKIERQVAGGVVPVLAE